MRPDARCRAARCAAMTGAAAVCAAVRVSTSVARHSTGALSRARFSSAAMPIEAAMRSRSLIG